MDIREYGGFIKLYRSLADWEWYQDSATLHLWIHLLLKVSRLPVRYKGEIIQPGSVATTIRQLSEETGLSRKNVRTALNHLKSTQELAIKATNRYTVISIEKWAFFQGYDELDGMPIGKQSGKQLANDWQTTGKQLANPYEQEYKNKRNKEYKNLINKEINNNHGVLEDLPPPPPPDIAARINSKLEEMRAFLEERNG